MSTIFEMVTPTRSQPSRTTSEQTPDTITPRQPERQRLHIPDTPTVRGQLRRTIAQSKYDAETRKIKSEMRMLWWLLVVAVAGMMAGFVVFAVAQRRIEGEEEG